jgi:chromosome segregation ATPase
LATYRLNFIQKEIAGKIDRMRAAHRQEIDQMVQDRDRQLYAEKAALHSELSAQFRAEHLKWMQSLATAESRATRAETALDISRRQTVQMQERWQACQSELVDARKQIADLQVQLRLAEDSQSYLHQKMKRADAQLSQLLKVGGVFFPSCTEMSEIVLQDRSRDKAIAASDPAGQLLREQYIEEQVR